jgi:hypothetical protein
VKKEEKREENKKDNGETTIDKAAYEQYVVSICVSIIVLYTSVEKLIQAVTY